jgi:ParB-like chromosome segregation protein Spo0J
MIPVSELVPYARNARTHSPEQVDQIAASIREFGWTVPIIIDLNNGIIAGHARALAAKKLGLAQSCRSLLLEAGQSRKSGPM